MSYQVRVLDFTMCCIVRDKHIHQVRSSCGCPLQLCTCRVWPARYIDFVALTFNSAVSRRTALARHPSVSTDKIAVTVRRCLRNQAPTLPHRLLRPQSTTLLLAGTCNPPGAINWLFHASAAAPSVVASSLLLVPQSGIHCLTICAIQLLDQTSFCEIWNPPACLPVCVSLTVR